MRIARLRRGISSFWSVVAATVFVLAILIILLWSPWEDRSIRSGRTLLLYCAAGISKPVQEIIADYKNAYGVEVQFNPGGTGKLLSQIRAAGGKGDLFIAADEYHMTLARKEGLVEEVLPIGYQPIVLIIKKSTQDRLRKEGKPVTGIRDLLRKDLKVVLANPELAAVGKLVKDLFSRPDINLWSELERELTEGSARVSTVGTVNELAQIIRTRDGYLGIVWRATAMQWPDLEIVETPELANAKDTLLIGVLAGAEGEEATAALQFARYLTARDRGLAVFEKYNYTVVPDADAWEVQPVLHLSAGAMLKPGIEEAVKDFEQREGVRVITSYEGCGILVSQMKAMKSSGKSENFPDAYFSCDTTFLAMVQDWFEAATIVSKNDMVMIVQKGNPKNVAKLSDLARSDLRVGLCHPDKSALGKLADELFKKTGMREKIFAPGWEGHVFPNSSAGHDLVNKLRVGALDVAIVYRSNAKANPENIKKHLDIIDIDIPEAMATQPFAIARNTRHKYLMRRLLRAIVADQTADRFRTLGFHWVYESKEP